MTEIDEGKTKLIFSPTVEGLSDLYAPGVVTNQKSETQLAVAAQSHKPGLQMETDLLAKIVNPDWSSSENAPLAMAFLLTKMPLAKGANLSISEAMAFYLTAVAEGANPFTGELYRTGPWRFATNVQAKINKLRRMGIPVGVPKFEPRMRDWPTDKKLTRYDLVSRREIAFAMPNEPGMSCTLPIGKSEVTQVVWLIENYMATNANWYDRMDHMLQVRALGRCVTFGGGEGVSDQIGDTPEDTKAVDIDTPMKIPVKK